MTARENFLQKWTEINYAIDNDYQRLIKSNSTIEEKIKEINKLLIVYQGKEGQMDCYYQSWREEGKIDLAKIYGDILSHKGKIFKLEKQLKTIRDSKCHKCNKKAISNPYVLNRTTKKIKLWSIDKVSEFGSNENFWDAPVIFCSNDCFQQSFYSKSKPKKENKPKSSKKTKKPEQNNSRNQDEKYLCWECGKEKTGKPFATEDTLDVCSENCYREKFGEICNQCTNRCLTYYQDKENPNINYCTDCYNKNQQEEREQEEQSTTHCHYCNAKSDGFYTCDKEECINKMVDEENNNPNRERERERESKSKQISLT